MCLSNKHIKNHSVPQGREEVFVWVLAADHDRLELDQEGKGMEEQAEEARARATYQQ
jgi:hypothetical protein